VGQAAPGIELKIADNGEVLVKGVSVLKEYYKRPDATAEVIDASGYFHTGDAGVIDANGQLRIIDRAKDVGKTSRGAMFAPNYIENKLKFFPHIKEAVCFGHGKDEVCAFINIDYEAVGNWAERQGLPYGGYVDLASKAKVLELVADCIDKVNADLASEPGMADTQVARFLVLHKELDPDDDELTRTRKVRRNFIADKYGVLVDALYTGKQQQFIETLVKFEDGRTGSVSATLTIVEAKLHPAGRLPPERNFHEYKNQRRRDPGHQEHQPAFRRRQGADRYLVQCQRARIRSIIGPNGAGKSSMLNCINGVYTPSEGSITFRGQTFSHMNSRQVAEMGVAPSRTWRCSRA
jgi:hypothetical protein